MQKILKGNFNEEGLKHKGWIIGHFINPESVFHNGGFEVKWVEHKKGDVNEGVAVNERGRSLAILVRGKFLIKFPSEGREVLLEKEGDYVFWDAGVSHTWYYPEDSLLVTIRWPSVKGDQKSDAE